MTPSGEKVDIFGTGGGEALAEQYGVPFLGSLPIDVAIREGGDRGQPVALDAGSLLGVQFAELAASVLDTVVNTEKPQVKIVN